MKRRPRSIWEHMLGESTEGPTVTVSLPREVAQQLVGMLMGSLELDGGGMGDGMDAGDGPMEPDEDDFGGASDGDDDDSDPLAALIGDDGEGDLDLDPPGGPDDDDSDDDDDEPEEALSRRPAGPRPGTALGERRRHEIRRR